LIYEVSKFEKSLNSFFFFFSSRRRHTISKRDWSSDVCSSDLRNVASCQTNENVPINNNDDTVPVNPVNSNGRRPTLPNNQIPINVAKTEITPLEILAMRAASVAKPASRSISVP